MDRFDKELKERILKNFRFQNNIITIQDIADYCNENKIPFMLDNSYENTFTVGFYYFKRDKER